MFITKNRLKSEVNAIKNDIQQLSEMMQEMRARHDKLLRYLGLLEVTRPSTTQIEKYPNNPLGGRGHD
jgi:hypothetical protein